MTFLAPSTGPVDLQGIVEVLPISLDRCVTHQAGSYTWKFHPRGEKIQRAEPAKPIQRKRVQPAGTISYPGARGAHQGLRRVDWGRGLPLPDRGRMSRESVQTVAGSDVAPVLDSAAASKAEMSGCAIGLRISDSSGRIDDAIRSSDAHRRWQPSVSRSGWPRFGSADGINGDTEHPRVFETSQASLEITLDMPRGCSALSVGRRAGKGCPPVSALLECPLWGSCGAACRIQCCKILGPARRLPATDGCRCGDHAAGRGGIA